MDLLEVQDLDEFVSAKQDELYSYLKALSRDPDLAADMAQSVLLRFIEQVERGRIQKDGAAGYLFTMARNEYFNARRAGSRVQTLEGTAEPVSDQSQEKREALSRDIHSTLIEALNGGRIDPVAQEVLRDRLLYNRSFAEICERTGKSRSTIHRLMTHGLGTLAQIFREAGLEPGLLED